MEGRLQPKLDEALARLRALPAQPAAEEGLLQPSDAASAADKPVDVPGTPSLPAVILAADAAVPDAGSADAMPAKGAGDEVLVHSSQADVAQPATVQESGDSLDLFGPPAAPHGAAPASAVGAQPVAERVKVKASAATGSSGVVQSAAVGPAPDQRGERAPAAASVTLDPLVIEAALVAALQSPAVEEALVELFSRTLSKALLRATAGGDAGTVQAHPPRQASARRVLLAGFPEPQQKALADALSASFEVRSWKPTSGAQLFQTLARLCKIVVFPEDADEEVDAGLKDMDVRVIRHAGNTSRLIERIEELS
ncbi:hypothetical protein [Azohydromonas australica]|uniref:hypothetical protein n=1 Tax=Azohydromonas australica TaxID=364039 RepID=UPI0012EB633A|nr:hypothetical protein [Azohydromonas australica]